SGGQWVKTETNEVEDKLHAYWRLKEPARGKEQLAKLKLLRRLAHMLVGGDPSNVPINHPIRWPGSWHRKSTPRLCEIISSTDQLDNEIDLDVALAALEDVAPQSHEEFGFTQKSDGSNDDEDPGRFQVPEGFEDVPLEDLRGEPYPKTADPKLIAAALAVVPNSMRVRVLRGQQITGSEDDPLDWEGWNYICMAAWNGTSGSKEGFYALLPWSRKWPKYIAGTEEEKKRFDRNTVNKWNALFTSPPKDLGAGTIFFLADKAAPGWREEYETEAEDQQEDTQPEKDLPKRIINNSDPTATAKDLAALIATRDDFLFNGNAAVRIAVEAGYPPRALEVVTDAVRVLAHKICTPVIPKGKRYNKVPLSKD